MIAWLIEYVGAQPVPLYLRKSPEGDRYYTLDPYQAARFKTREEAEMFMHNPLNQHPPVMSYIEPWAAVEHALDMKCMDCKADIWMSSGREGICSTCIPF